MNTKKTIIAIIVILAAAALMFILAMVIRGKSGTGTNNRGQQSESTHSSESTGSVPDISEENSSRSDMSSVISEPTYTSSTSSELSQPETSEASFSQWTETVPQPTETEELSVPQSTETEEPAPQWTETETSGEYYVNTDNVYSRISAIQGSDAINQYSVNDKVTVVAITDTDYFKLEDGTFIHSDYLSEEEIKINLGSNLPDYVSTTANGYTIERVSGITYVDGVMIANKTYTLPRDFDPGIQPDAYDAFWEMQSAAEEDGISLYIVSGYRSYYDQDAIYARYVDSDGKDAADTYSSRPGHSDHQTGYTFDLNSLEQSFEDTPEGIWLAENCARFGFIIRYPKGKDAYTGYMFEPWHVRYIGREKAEAVTASGLSLEEYYGITSDYALCTDE